MTPDLIPELEIEIRMLQHLIHLNRHMINLRKEKIAEIKTSMKKKNAKYQVCGYARANSLTKERRTEIARNAAKVRWGKR